MTSTAESALDVLERARRAQEQHDRRNDVQLRLEGSAGGGSHAAEAVPPTEPNKKGS